MTRGEANSVSVGDFVRTLGGNVKYKVINLEHAFDSDGNNAIVATLMSPGGFNSFKTNLELCKLPEL